MFGVLTSAVRIYQDRLGYGIYSGPIGTAVFMITVKWVSLRDIRFCSYSAFKSRAPNKLDEELYFAHIDNMETQNFIIYHKCFHKVLQYCFCFAPVTKNEGKKRTLSRQKCLHSTSGARILLRRSCFDASLLFRGKNMNVQLLNGFSNWRNSLSEKHVCVTAIMTCSFTPAGVGLRLCPQFLPCVTGCVLHSAAAQEEPLCWDGTQRSQTQLLHPLLLCMMHLFI